MQRVPFPGVKRPGPETKPSLPSNAVDKNEWICSFIPQYTFMVYTGTTHSPSMVSTCTADSLAGKIKITVIEYKPTKCTFSKLIF
jgi:hypothetical protein